MIFCLMIEWSMSWKGCWWEWVWDWKCLVSFDFKKAIDTPQRVRKRCKGRSFDTSSYAGLPVEMIRSITSTYCVKHSSASMPNVFQAHMVGDFSRMSTEILKLMNLFCGTPRSQSFQLRQSASAIRVWHYQWYYSFIANKVLLLHRKRVGNKKRWINVFLNWTEITRSIVIVYGHQILTSLVFVSITFTRKRKRFSCYSLSDWLSDRVESWTKSTLPAWFAVSGSDP